MNQQTSMYEMMGGESGIRALADAFYDAMEKRSETATIRAMHGEDLSPIKQKLFEFLSGWFGGPRLYFEKYGSVCMHGPHSPYAIGPAERDQWLMCMNDALNTVGTPDEVREALRVPMYRFADALRNRESS